MQLFTDPEDPVERLFALQQKNLIIAQSESGQLWVYYLNTGQFLFSPGTLESPIQEIGVDMDQKLMFKTEHGWKTTLF
jgi:hypothetical protein